MKSFKIIAAVISALVMTSSSFAQEKDDKIGTVNMQKLLAGYFKAADLLKTFKEYEKGILEKNELKAEEVKALTDEANEVTKKAENPSITREKKDELFREAQLIRSEAKARQDARIAWLNRKRTAFNEKQKVELGILREEIMVMVREVGDAEGYDYIFDRSGASGANVPILSYAKDAIDLTAAMLDRINRDAPEEGADEGDEGTEDPAKEQE